MKTFLEVMEDYLKISNKPQTVYNQFDEDNDELKSGLNRLVNSFVI